MGIKIENAKLLHFKAYKITKMVNLRLKS